MQEPNILYEDPYIIVVDKPAGLMVHAAPGKKEKTLVDWLLAHYPELRDVTDGGDAEDGEDEDTAERPGIVHRLDRDTSGVLVVARTLPAFARLKKQFARREIQKTYRAFVYGRVQDDRGIIDKPIGRARGSGSRRSVRSTHGALREAQTAFRTIARTSASAPPASYLEVFPKTGRTHQIRVHLAAVHHPVVCDSLYAPRRECILGFKRLALHALSLSFKHPATGKPVSFHAPLPADFVEAERRLTA